MFYIFLIAVLNLGLGFAAAWHLGRRYNSLDVASRVLDSSVSGEDLDDDQQDADIESSMDFGMDEDDDTQEEEDEEDIESLLNGVAEDSLDGKNDGGDSEEGNAKESTEQPQDTLSGELDADLDKLFENIDI